MENYILQPTNEKLSSALAQLCFPSPFVSHVPPPAGELNASGVPGCFLVFSLAYSAPVANVLHRPFFPAPFWIWFPLSTTPHPPDCFRFYLTKR